MVANFTDTKEYLDLMNQLNSTNTSPSIVANLTRYADTIYDSDLEKKYGEPMVAIGVYIAIASLCCTIAMGVDLVHGFRSRKLWFPVKYFHINALTLTLIAVAMKLPVDLSGSMPGDVDQMAKLGSVAFMCTMMANFLPCLATMDSMELLTTVTALGVLVITLVVNVCIQITTGVVGRIPNGQVAKHILESIKHKELDVFADLRYTTVATVYVVLLLLLLIIHASSSLVILKFKQIIEPKYQQGHETASKDFQSTTGELLTVEKLQHHVSKYWIMAGSGSPQFVSACSATTAASGVICVVTSILHTLTIGWTIKLIIDNSNENAEKRKNNNTNAKDTIVLYASAYDWSTLMIFVVQSIGIILGTLAPLFRCFASISFKWSIESLSNQIKVLKVEKYWTQKLNDWKYGSISLPLLSISLPFGNYKLKVVVRTLKNLIINICIQLQVGVVVSCKIIALIPFFFTLCLRCLKWLFRAVFSSRGTRIENLEQRKYVLQLENEDELGESTLKRLLKSFNLLIHSTKEPKNLMKLIEAKSTNGLQGVKMFEKDNHHVQCSPSKEVYPNRWSLPVVTLTTIAVTLPNIGEVEVESLLKGVREGLKYVTLVEETLNAPNDYGSVQKAAKRLWEEVDFCHTWLGIRLKDIASEVKTAASQVDTTTQTVQVFLKKANKIMEVSKSSDDASEITSICAKSMSCVTETIIGDKERHKELFDYLTSSIADIMAECLTNLPQVIEKKCHTDVIEKREASVEDATKLLGETKKIIKTLQDKRRAYFCEP